jgi:hypothetical protein
VIKKFQLLAISTFSIAVLGLAVPCAFPAWAQNSSVVPPSNNGTLGNMRQLEPGQPPVFIHLTVEAAKRARKSSGTSSGTSGAPLYYQGGTYDGSAGPIGVETAPRIYLVFWGSQWDNNDPSGEASILEGFLQGASGSPWLNTVTQYCQGVASGTYFCNGAGTPAGNTTGEYVSYWYDNASAAPAHPTQSQFASEAVNAAGHFGVTSVADNASAQYVIATATGNNSSGFETNYCAYHSATTSSYGNIAYTNLPYITDAGEECGANFNGLGPDSGITIVEGHEAAETITDQFAGGGWLDSNNNEIGDKCAWIYTGQGAVADVTFSDGTYPVQSLYSNAFNGDAGGCVMESPGAPTINFAVGTQTYGEAPFVVSATSNSTGAITYSVVSGPATISGSMVTLTGAGTVTLEASQAAAGDYTAGTQTATFTVLQAAQTITFAQIGMQMQGGTVTLTATGGGSGNPVTFTSWTPSVCAVSGSTATLSAPGTCTIAANQLGNANYLAAQQVTRSFTVTPVFTLTVTPTSQSETPPTAAPVVLTLAPVNGFSGAVTLSCSGLPAGARCTSLPLTFNLNGKNTIVLNLGVKFAKGTTPGTYAVTFAGVDGKYNNAATASFAVQ